MASSRSPGRWPNGARAAISLTLDNMGEAADLNRKLWPADAPIGAHYTVTSTIPRLLSLLRKHDIPLTYFVETWNLGVYGDFIRGELLGKGVEMGWHAWQHEAWAKLSDEAEAANFARSFGGEEGVGRWVDEGVLDGYVGFRPPGGIVRPGTVGKCLQNGLRYLSPAGERAAVVEGEGESGELVVLPFKWACVDAYFYMETFAGLRRMKGEYGEEVQSSRTLVERYIKEIDRTIEEGGFLAPLFHPFLTTTDERVEAMETVVEYLVKKRGEGLVWIARCRDVEEYVRQNKDVVGTDPGWDLSSWR